MKVTKKVFIDVETSGTNNYKNGIWQIAARLYYNGRFIEGIKLEFKIFKQQEWNPTARDMCPIKNFEGYLTARQGYKKFREFLTAHVDPFNTMDKMFFYAYNSPFDEKFLRSFFYNNGDKYFGSYFWVPTICVMRLAGDYLTDRIPHMENFKQHTVAEELGIEVDDDELHDAMYDIELTRDIYNTIKGENNVHNGQ